MNTLVWGATFVLVKTALDDVSPVLFLALRFSLATIALLIFFGGADGRVWSSARQATKIDGLSHGLPVWKATGAGALAGSFLFSGYLFQTLGLRLTTAPKSAFLTGLTSVMVPLLAALVYRIRPQVSEVAGVLWPRPGWADDAGRRRSAR